MPANHGLTLGKFMPLHAGHEFLLETAVQHCHHLTVLLGVSSVDTIPYSVRRAWLQEFIGNLVRGTGKSFVIHADPDPDVGVQKDKDGTVVDESYWTQWLDQNKRYLDPINVVFTSDPYGKEIAKRISAKWFPVDPGREVVNISASEIRFDTFRYFSSVSAVAKPYMGKTIAIIGAESTGKSTLAKRMALTFETTYAPEYGRIAYEANNNLTYNDFTDIVKMQAAMIKKAQVTGSGVCFTDTEAIVTAKYAPAYLGREHTEALVQAGKQAETIDLYLVMAPTVPFVQDGTRVQTLDERLEFHKKLIGSLQVLGYRYVVIDNDNFRDREARAIAVVSNFLYDNEWQTPLETEIADAIEDRS